MKKEETMKRLFILCLLILLWTPAHAELENRLSRVQGRIDQLCDNPRLSRALHQWCSRTQLEMRGCPVPDENDPNNVPVNEDPNNIPVNEEPGNDFVNDPVDDEPLDIPPGVDEIEAEVLSLVNAIRRAEGIHELQHNESLYQSAKNHAKELAETGVLSHVSENGSGPGDRIDLGGYFWHVFGENIAQGFRDAEHLVDAWMTSEPHRQNLLSTSFCDAGVGVAEDAEGVTYWVMKFACNSQSN